MKIPAILRRLDLLATSRYHAAVLNPPILTIMALAKKIAGRV